MQAFCQRYLVSSRCRQTLTSNCSLGVPSGSDIPSNFTCVASALATANANSRILRSTSVRLENWILLEVANAPEQIRKLSEIIRVKKFPWGLAFPNKRWGSLLQLPYESDGSEPAKHGCSRDEAVPWPFGW